MKTLALIFSDIVRFIRRRFYLFLLMLLILAVAIISSFLVMGIFGYQTSGFSKVKAVLEKDKWYRCDMSFDFSVEECVDLLEQYKADNILLESYIYWEGRSTVVAGVLNAKGCYFLGSLFSGQDAGNGKAGINVGLSYCNRNGLVPENLTEMSLNGMDYNVIGIRDTSFYDIILPLEDFLAAGLTVDNIQVELPLHLSETRKEKLFEECQGYGLTLYPYYENNADLMQSIACLVVLVLVFMYCIFIVMSLYSVWNKENMVRYMIYKISGCSNGKFFAIIVAEGFTIAILAFILSTCANQYIQSLQYSMNLPNISDHFSTIGMIYFCVIALFLVIEARKVMRKEPANKSDWR